MRIELTAEFKSIKQLNDIELPRFVILTGLNGAGKSQLLQAISTKKAVINIDGKPATNIRAFSGGFGDIVNSEFYGSKLERFCIALQSKFWNFTYYKKQNPQSPYYNYDTLFSKEEKEILSRVKQARKDKDAELAHVDRLEIMKNIPPGLVIQDSDTANNWPRFVSK